MNPPPLPTGAAGKAVEGAVTPPPVPGSDSLIFDIIEPDHPNVSVGAGKRPEDRSFPCVECGGRMEYNPAVKSLKCPYCGYTAKREEASTGEVLERDYETFLGKLASYKKSDQTAETTRLIRCTGCGAQVMFGEKTVTDQCPYCQTHLENLPEEKEELIRPESVLPFGITDKQAVKNFQDWVNSRWFAPNCLKELARVGRFSGLYLPYFTFDAMTHTTYQGQKGIRRTRTERDSDGNSRSVTYNDWYSCSGDFDHFFDDVLVCSSRKLPPELVQELTPWDLENLEPFTPDFLSGFKTEKYTIDLPESFNLAHQHMERVLVNLTRRDIGGDEQRITWRDSQYMGISFKHLLLPVWISSYNYYDKTYQVLVNGRTGEVQGYRPYSIWKIARLVMIILVSIGMIFYLANGRKRTRSNVSPTVPYQQNPFDSFRK